MLVLVLVDLQLRLLVTILLSLMLLLDSEAATVPAYPNPPLIMTHSQHDASPQRFDGTTLGPVLFESCVELDPSSPVLLLSDLHFGDGSKTDLFAGQDESFIEFVEAQRAGVATIVFLGDILDMPQGWSLRRIFRAHPSLTRYLRELAQTQRVIFVRGNHDWSVDYEGLFPGATRSEAVLIGERILAWHGHQVDLHMNPGVDDAARTTYLHAIAERLAGCRLVPPLEQHDSTANRIGLSLAVAWARVLVARAALLRSVGRTHRAAELEASVRYFARSVCGDPADLFGATKRTLLGKDFDTVVCGHSHEPGVVQTARGVYANVGTWACGTRSYGLYDGERIVVREVDTGRELGDERYVSVPEHTEPQDLFDWWTQLWRGGLLRGVAPLANAEQKR